MAAVRIERRDFLAEMDHCAVCGTRDNLTVHEMARGSSRNEALSARCCWLVACWGCNSGVLTDATVWPLEKQLALKLLTDAEYFDLSRFNEIRGRAESAITVVDVALVFSEVEAEWWR
jgi:hypothetical protein